MALWPRAARRTRTLVAALDVPARSRADLLLSVLLAVLSDSRPDRPGRHPACGRLPRKTVGASRRRCYLVCADAALAGFGKPRAQPPVRSRPGGFGSAGAERLAARCPGGLPDRFPLVRDRRPRLLLLPVGRHAARGRLPMPLLRAARSAAGFGRGAPSVASQLVSAPVAVVPDLLRVGTGQAAERRARVATPNRPRSLLRKRSAAELDRLVRPAASAQVSSCCGAVHAGRRTRTGLDAFPAAPLAHRLLLHRHSVSDRNHSHRKPRLLESSRAGAGSPVARRSLPRRRRAPCAPSAAGSG